MKTPARVVPFAAVAAMLASTAMIASCASEAPPAPAPLPPAPVPVAAAPPPPVALSNSVLEAASAYRIYMRRAAEISPAFASGDAVEQSLVSAEAYEPKQLLRGAIAYGALVALQSPQFVASVRTYAVDPTTRRDLADHLRRDPSYSAALPSAANAAGLVVATLNGDAAKVRHAGELVKQSAYDVQHQAWSKAAVIAPADRLARAKTLSAQPITPPAGEVQLLGGAVNGSDASGVSVLGVSGEAIPAPYTAVVSRALAVAAIAALGEGGADQDAALAAMLDEPSSSFCLNMSKLNLYQCLSVAKPYYEDVFCLGQHILLDTSQCVAKAVGAAPTTSVAAAAPITPAAIK